MRGAGGEPRIIEKAGWLRSRQFPVLGLAARSNRVVSHMDHGSPQCFGRPFPDQAQGIQPQSGLLKRGGQFRLLGFPARSTRKENPRWFSNGSTVAVISRTG